MPNGGAALGRYLCRLGNFSFLSKKVNAFYYPKGIRQIINAKYYKIATLWLLKSEIFCR